MHMTYRRYFILKAVITFATKSTKRERRKFQKKSKDSLLTSDEASSGGGGSASTSLKVNSEDVAATDDQISGAPRTAVLQACTITSGLLLAGGLLLRQVNAVVLQHPELFRIPDSLLFFFGWISYDKNDWLSTAGITPCIFKWMANFWSYRCFM